MKRWEYCDVTWQPDQVIVTMCAAGGAPRTKSFDAETWPQLLAKLGASPAQTGQAKAAPTPMSRRSLRRDSAFGIRKPPRPCARRSRSRTVGHRGGSRQPVSDHHDYRDEV